MKNQRRSPKPVGHMEPIPRRPRTHPAKPVAHYVVVPKGSSWECACPRKLVGGERVMKLGKDIYCVQCVKGGARPIL